MAEVHPALDWPSFSQHILVRDRYSRRFVPFGQVVNSVQEEVLYDPWRRADLQGRPFRAIVVKARQMGFSTAIQVRFLHRAACWENVSSLTVANLDATTRELHSTVEDAYRRLPALLRPTLEPGSGAGHTLKFTHGSSIRTWTAGTKEIARGFAIWQALLSEAAYYDYLGTSLDALQQSVPDEPGTAIILESTAHGQGDPFHREWLRACEGHSDFVPIFAGWHQYPHYRLEERLWPSGFPDDLTDEEAQLAETFELTLEQLAWRRHILRTKCRGELDILHQEYPITAEEAFIASGALYFRPQLISNFARLARKVEPRIIGRINASRGADQKLKVVIEPDPSGAVTAFEAPREGHRYGMFVDSAGDISDDEASEFASREVAQDYNVAAVFDFRTLTCAAVMRSQSDIDVFGADCAYLGWLYNNALIAPEITGGYGLIIVRELRALHYRRIYLRRALDTSTGLWTQRYGWATTIATRPLMLENLRTFLRDHPERLRYRPLAQEMSTFVVNKRNKAAAAPGSHDDIVMAFAGALELCAEHPQPSTKAERLARRADRQKTGPKKKRAVADERYVRAPDA